MLVVAAKRIHPPIKPLYNRIQYTSLAPSIPAIGQKSYITLIKIILR
jgi:hypothetical protein